MQLSLSAASFASSPGAQAVARTGSCQQASKSGSYFIFPKARRRRGFSRQAEVEHPSALRYSTGPSRLQPPSPRALGSIREEMPPDVAALPRCLSPTRTQHSLCRLSASVSSATSYLIYLK